MENTQELKKQQVKSRKHLVLNCDVGGDRSYQIPENLDDGKSLDRGSGTDEEQGSSPRHSTIPGTLDVLW